MGQPYTEFLPWKLKYIASCLIYMIVYMVDYLLKLHKISHYFPTPSHADSLQSAMVWVLTPRSWQTLQIRAFPLARRPVVEHLPAHHHPFLVPTCYCPTWGFSHFLYSTHHSEIIFPMCLFIFLLTLSYSYNLKKVNLLTKLFTPYP